MTCELCGKSWDLLLAHVVTSTGKRTIVECPACGHLMVVAGEKKT